MDKIILDGITATEFVAFFDKLSVAKQVRFIKERRSEILALKNVQIFKYLCAREFYNFMPAFMELGGKEETFEAFVKFVLREQARIKVSQENAKLVMQFASQRLDMLKFLREETIFFVGETTDRIMLHTVIYKNATQECLEYLLGWAIRNHISVSRTIGEIMFRRAKAETIRSYCSRISFFSGSISGIGFQPLLALYRRTDLTEDVKTELIFYAINHFRVSDTVISKLRKVGMCIR